MLSRLQLSDIIEVLKKNYSFKPLIFNAIMMEIKTMVWQRHTYNTLHARFSLFPESPVYSRLRNHAEKN